MLIWGGGVNPPDLDAAGGEMTAGVGHMRAASASNVQVVLSVRALRNIALGIAVLVFINAGVDFVIAGDTLPFNATVGRLVVVGFLLGSALLAHMGLTLPAFLVFSAVEIFGVFNAAEVAGFGLYSPALLYTLAVVVLSFALFGYRRGWLWSIPSICTWMFVVVSHGFKTGTAVAQLPAGAVSVPSPTAWVLTQLSVGLIVVAVIRQYEKQAAGLIADEMVQHSKTLDNLVESDRLSAEREKFMAHLSHELRTPLAAMSNAMTLAQHPKASDAMKERSLKTLGGAILNLQALLNDALDSFKFSRGEFALHETEFSVSEFLQSIETLYTGMANSRGLQLTVNVQCPDGLRLIGDPMRLGQMLSNLISNAIKFTQSGGVFVNVRLSDVQHGTWRFEVKDTGPGISIKDQLRLFKPFVQVEHQQQSDVKGTGLGLSIVAQLAQAMGGKVGMTSELGSGSVFYFEVPLRFVLSSPAELKAV